MRKCPNAHGRDCVWWKPLSGSLGGTSGRACHYCVEKEHSRPRGENGECMAFAAGKPKSAPKQRVPRLSREAHDYIMNGRVDHRIKVVEK